MNFNKNIQYAFLFALYLARAGRARVEDAAANLNLSKSFLEQIARKLRIAGVVFSVKGPGGGYELSKDVRMIHVFSAVATSGFLSKEEFFKYNKGQPEERAFAHFSTNLALSLYPVLNRTVHNVMKEFVSEEMAILNSLSGSTLEN